MSSLPATEREGEYSAFNSHLFLAGCALMAGLLSAFEIPIVGSLPAPELVLGLVAFTAFCTLLLHKRLPRSIVASRWLWAFLAAQLVTLAGYMIADFYRSSAPLDIVRGWSRVVFLSMDTLAVAILFGDDRRNFRLFMIGAALSGIAMTLTGRVTFGDAWKFGYAWPVTILAVLIASELGVWVTAATLIVLAGINNVEDFRSLCGICVAIAAISVIQAFDRRQRLLVFSVVALVGVAGFAVLKSRPKDIEASERGTRSNVERSSMLIVAWQAFTGSPLIGQGSWFSNSDVIPKFLKLRHDLAEEAGVHGYAADELDEDEKIALHSQILVSLAEGGIFGGAFFIFYGLGLVWGLGYCIFLRIFDRSSTIYSLILLGGIWDLFMSPFSGGHRINISVSIGVLLLLIEEKANARSALEDAV
jgi:hypothetical protein